MAENESRELAAELLVDLRPYRSQVPVEAVTVPWADFDGAVRRWREIAGDSDRLADCARRVSQQLRRTRQPCLVRDDPNIAAWVADKTRSADPEDPPLLEAAQRAMLEFVVGSSRGALLSAECAMAGPGVLLVSASVAPDAAARAATVMDEARASVAEFFQVHTRGSTVPDRDSDFDITFRRACKLGRWRPRFTNAPTASPRRIRGSAEDCSAPDRADTEESEVIGHAWRAAVRCFDAVHTIRFVTAPKGFALTSGVTALVLWSSREPADSRPEGILSTGHLGLTATLCARGCLGVHDEFRLPPAAAVCEPSWPDDSAGETNPFGLPSDEAVASTVRALRRAVTWGAAGVCTAGATM